MGARTSMDDLPPSGGRAAPPGPFRSSLDREFSPTGAQRRATLVALVVGGAVGLAAFSGWVPGLHPNLGAPTLVTFDGQPYYWSEILVPVPIPGESTTSPQEVVNHNATFWLWVVADLVDTVRYLDGNVSLSGGGTYTFTLGGSTNPATWVGEFIAPGGAAVVLWPSGTLAAELLVLAP
jgi:hypothetical protein